MMTAARDFLTLVGGSMFVLFIGAHLLLGGFDPSYWTSMIVVACFRMQRIHVGGAFLCVLILLFVCFSAFIRHRK